VDGAHARHGDHAAARSGAAVGAGRLRQGQDELCRLRAAHPDLGRAGSRGTLLGAGGVPRWVAESDGERDVAGLHARPPRAGAPAGLRCPRTTGAHAGRRRARCRTPRGGVGRDRCDRGGGRLGSLPRAADGGRRRAAGAGGRDRAERSVERDRRGIGRLGGRARCTHGGLRRWGGGDSAPPSSSDLLHRSAVPPDP
jgi:hypothetical protein